MNLIQSVDGWQLLAGLGLFLLGMNQLERAIHALAGSTFNAWLRRLTGHPLQSVLFGIVTTAILQSSSILGLMVLAFVGAGVLPMRNALGVILGSNIGSTFTGWIVATIGFSVDLESAALPLIGVGALAIVALAESTRRHAWGRTAWSLGLLLLGIGYMTSAATDFAHRVDASALAGAHPLVFFLAGVLLTLVVRTSAATILIALSALNAGVIDLPQAAAVAIGADLGTTSTMLIAAMTGVAAKKQVAMFHLLFNAITNVLALLFLLPHVKTIVGWYGISDPLLALPAFHSTFNLLGALLFYPFLGRIADGLSKRFNDAAKPLAVFLPSRLSDDHRAALTALEDEVRGLFRRVLSLNLAALNPDAGRLNGNHPAWYEAIKRLEGEIHAYGRKFQSLGLTDDEARRLDSLLQAAREAVQAAKDVKNVWLELDDFRRQANPALAALLVDFERNVRVIYTDITGLVDRPAGSPASATRIADSEAALRDAQQDCNQRMFRDEGHHGLSGSMPSALLNVFHEVYGSARALLRGCRSLLLDELP